MKIAIIGAGGNVGRCLVAESISRGHEVTAIGPNRDNLLTLGPVSVKVALMAETSKLSEALRGHDAVISAVRFVHYEPKDLLDAIAAAGAPRLLVVGGAGSLKLTTGNLLMESPTFPEAALPEAKAGAEVLAALRSSADRSWSYLSPSAIFSSGERTAAFRLGGDELLIDENGKSHISYQDFAVAMLDEVEDKRHQGQRFTVGY